MGYTTEFYGAFKFDRPVSAKLRDYINRFADTRHVKRDNDLIKQIHLDWETYILDETVGLGDEGEFFAYPHIDYFNLDSDKSIIDINTPPDTQPSLWCQWVISDDNTELLWDGCEKFYCYVQWLDYLINNFFNPFNYMLNGDVRYQGEDEYDKGHIIIKDNIITVSRESVIL